MFQTFDEVSDPTLGAERVAQLREWLAAKDLDGFIVPRSDEHQGEYVAERSERLKWLTGFTGSAGVVLVLASRAVLFVDGRYTLQARQQADPAVFTHRQPCHQPASGMAEGECRQGLRLGFDPWLHTISEVEALSAALAENEAELVAVDNNPIDELWAGPAGSATAARRNPPDRICRRTCQA